MAIKHITGNVIDLAIDNEWCFAHGCNCYNKMGAGLAKEVRDRLPELYQVDQVTSRGDKSKLGHYTCYTYDWGLGFNLYTQYYYSWTNPQFDLEALDDALRAAISYIYVRYWKREIVIPRIGAGLGLSKWNVIEDVIENLCPKDFAIYVASK